MIISTLMALALVSTPEEALREEAAELGRDLTMAQICEVIEAASVDTDTLLGKAGDIFTRGEALQIPEASLDETAMQAANALEAELSTKYADPVSLIAVHDELTATCQDLIQTKPDLFKAYQAD